MKLKIGDRVITRPLGGIKKSPQKGIVKDFEVINKQGYYFVNVPELKGSFYLTKDEMKIDTQYYREQNLEKILNW